MTASDPRFTIKPTLDDLKKRNAKARTKMAETGVAMKKCAVFLDRWVQENFKTQGGKVGGWIPFANGGRVTRKKGEATTIDTTAKLLQDTGRLRLSFAPFATKNNAGIGSDLPYSKTHNEGEGRVPQRRILPIESEVNSDIKDILEAHAKSVARIYD